MTVTAAMPPETYHRNHLLLWRYNAI